jgi:BASS family bile acid:Na+ symporter
MVMFFLNDLQKLLVFGFMITSMLSIGLRSGVGELRALMRSRGYLARALVANFVLVPLVGFTLAHVFPLSPEASGALMLLACVPGGLSAIHFTSEVEGKETIAEALFVALTLTAFIVSPWVVRLVIPAAAGLDFPHGRALAFLAISILAPTCAGIVLHDRAPGLAPKLSKVLSWTSFALFVAFEIATKHVRKEAIQTLGGPAVAAMALFILGSMAIGWLLGGPDRRGRQVLTSVSSMRNTVVCLVIAKYSAMGAAALTPLVAFSLLMVIPNTLFTIINSVANRRAKAHGAHPVAQRVS